ncbi:uncharacterized protein LOC120505258 [Passer montanus]|uniref:uncharacterized protein LOC120505258 n=1 Tax=Passer montanus TaxID=9160 RepID=UPI00196061DF|nr:uncharacterized protein LOC120505258 [Passer montanus]
MGQARWALPLTLLLLALPARHAAAAPWHSQGFVPAVETAECAGGSPLGSARPRSLCLSLCLSVSAAWERQAVQEEEEEEAPQEGREAVPGPGESSRAFSPAGPDYQDGGGQSSVETSKVLHEILGELKMILGGVRSLSLSSAVSRRSAGSSGAEPGAAGGGAEPGAVLGRADTNAAEGSSFKTYCIEGILAILGSILLGMVLCCAFHFWRKRKK